MLAPNTQGLTNLKSIFCSLPAMQETRVCSLDWERPLAMSFHSNILVWRSPWTEEPAGLQSMVRPLIKLKNSGDRAVLWEEDLFI